MKSQKAKEFIESETIMNMVYQPTAVESVAIAEREMIDKAVEAFRSTCNSKLNTNICMNNNLNPPNCYKNECAYMKYFINQLTN